MSKRSLEDVASNLHAHKRLKLSRDRLSHLSDELLLRILSFLPVETLALCQSVSRGFMNLAGDSSLWRQAYFDAFVLPRLTRTKRRRRKVNPDTQSVPLLRFAQALEEGNAVGSEPKTDWKQRYKIRYRWTNGLCDLKEIPIHDRSPLPPVVARMLDTIVYTADLQHGLRAWSYKKERRLLATYLFDGNKERHLSQKPSSIAVDRLRGCPDRHQLVVGHDDGSFTIHIFRLDTRKFDTPCPQQHSSQDGPITAVALSWPYLLTMTRTRTLSLYTLSEYSHQPHASTDEVMPLLLSSMKSQSIRGALSISIRQVRDIILACLAYSSPTLGSGWTAGMQELTFNKSGGLIASRLASTPADTVSLRPSSHWSGRIEAGTLSQQIHIPLPTSISYSHPYLLMAHADNTLTLYNVVSLESSLTISYGTRLWGHTSSVFEAQVGCRGRAVSVSRRGDEVRVWQLEGAAADQNGFNSTDVEPNSSVQLVPEKPRPQTPARLAALSRTLSDRGSGLGLTLAEEFRDPVTRGWVGFDEENVVLLKSTRPGSGQALAVYDFT